MINQVYLCFTNIAFWDPNSAPICASRQRSGARVTVPMSDKQFDDANRFFSSTSNICSDALFIKYKYTQDDVKWLN